MNIANKTEPIISDVQHCKYYLNTNKSLFNESERVIINKDYLLFLKWQSHEKVGMLIRKIMVELSI